MYKVFDSFNSKIYLFNESKHNYPFVISIPHSGILITEEMNKNMNKEIILANMDWYLPQLYNFLEDMGFTVVINNISRYVIDPNRSLKDETIDLSYSKNLIYTKTTFNKKMYINKLSQEEIQERIDEYYIPYHKEIEKQIKEKLKYFDKVYLIDLHSFGKNVEADIVLGNDYGKTTSKEFFCLIKNEFEKNKFKVSDNKPYKGGYITKYYKEKFSNCETLQIELWYGTYIDSREFGEEYLPKLNEELFKCMQCKMENIFNVLKKI